LYAAVTRDAAQRRSWTFYEAVKNYHQETDIIDTLNFEAVAEVIKGLYYTLLEI
jgi:hypothetical protein